MRPLLFVVFFTLGVGLMVVSGYVPKSASARGVGGGPETDLNPRDVGFSLYADRPRAWAERDANSDWQSSYSTPADVEPNDSNAYADDSLDTEAERPPTEEYVADSPLEADADAGYEPPQDVVPLGGDDEYPAEENEELTKPTASAGQDRVVWAGWDELKLDASKSEGEELTYDWLQVGGPRELKIEDTAGARTRATGLAFESDPEWRDQVYEFELMVRDSDGEEAFDEVRFIVKAGPELTVSPRADRRFEYRDGYLLAHYEAWDTNVTSYESMFQVVSHTELAFTRVAGDQYEIVPDQVDGLFVYRITVFGQEGVETSWLEFLVDTSERIPGILQLGVRWVAQ